LELCDINGNHQIIELSPGEPYHIEQGCQHRVTAIEDCQILEASTPELDDIVSLEGCYGGE